MEQTLWNPGTERILWAPGTERTLWASRTERALDVQGSRFFIIRHIHNHTSIISSEMQVELKKNTAFT